MGKNRNQDDDLEQLLALAGNRGGKSAVESDEEAEEELELEQPQQQQMQKKKGKKKQQQQQRATATVLDDDETSPPPEEEDGGKKKNRKKGSKQDMPDDDAAESSARAEEVPDQLDDEVPRENEFSGKKKRRNNKKKLLDYDSEQVDMAPEPAAQVEDEVSVDNEFFGKKKKKNRKKLQNDDSEQVDELAAQVDDEVPEFSGKKKKKNKSMDEDGEQVDLAPEPAPQVEDEVPENQFSGKKKKSKKKVVKLDDDDEQLKAEQDAPVEIELPGKSKKKQDKVEDEPAVAEQEAVGAVPDVEAPEAPSKPSNDFKKKKSKEKAHTEDDLDKLLMEIETTTTTTTSNASKKKKPAKGKVADNAAQAEAAPNQGTKEESEPTSVPEKEEHGESAAAKKKRKKKEKEKAAKTAATEEAAAKAEEPSKAKGPSRAVREMQERLAKQKELEEQLKREAEERLRKEEEELARLAQLEKEKAEAKQRRKEREKQKYEEKKKAGLILTKKEKEEAKRRALQREQILNQQGEQVLNLQPAQPKKPKYEAKKKRKPDAATSDEKEPGELETTEADIDDNHTEEEHEEEVEEQEVKEQAQEEEEEDDWDAKSWDDDVPLPPVPRAFADEEEEEEEEDRQEPIKPAAPAKVLSPQTVTAKDEPKEAEASASKETETSKDEDSLRSPICCILGHVDTGKTKLLDCIRKTKVQEGEAGGITQQIGATYLPRENIREKTKADANLRVPGLLVIDTPGHESFTNLRARGSGLCDIAVLVIDIMHALEPQTIESLNLLKMRKTPYVIALNKVDRLYGWKSRPNSPITASFKNQTNATKDQFDARVKEVITQLKEQGLNSELYWKNKELAKRLKEKSELNWGDDDFANIVPTSAITGEGIPDLLLLLVELTQKMLETRLTYKSELECTVLEVKVVEGLGTTIDVVLVNGVLHEGDHIVVCGMQGPIETHIRALLTPHPMKELRVKGSYQHHKELKAAQGIKITAQGLEHAIAGTQLYVVGPDDDVEDIKNEAIQDVNNVLSRIDKSGEGVCVQASTLGSLEALLEFLKSPAVKIPVSGISIGPVHKKDVNRASTMLVKKREYAAILAFDVKVNPEARDMAEELGVRIFTADIIYHLFDQFTAYMEQVKNEKRSNTEGEAVFPCILKIIPGCVFNMKDPIVVGVEVLEGTAKVGTPLCVPKKGFVDIGRIASLEINHKVVDTAKKGEKVAVKIVGNAEESQKSFGRHFEIEDELVSHITRRSIDVLKENFRDDVSNDEWRLVAKLKTLFQIQ